MAVSQKDFIDEARPLAEDIIDHAMTAGKKYGITDVEVTVAANDKQNNAVENGEVISVSVGKSFGVSVSLFAGDRTLSFQKNSLDKAAILSAVDENMKVIHMVPENPSARLLDSSMVYKGKKPDLDIYDAQKPDQNTMIDYAKKAEAAAMAEPGIKATRSASVAANDYSVLTLATNGVDKHEKGTSYQASVQAVAADDDGNMQIGFDYSIALHFADMADPAEIGKKAGQDAKAKLGAVFPATGEATIILSPKAAAEFFSLVYAAIDGSAVYKNATFLKDKVGQQVMAKGITMEDDPLIKRGLSSSATDGAGQKSEKLTFIKDGVLQLYNVGLEESRLLGVQPIGRDSGPTNTRILPGDKTPEELMKDVKEGFYITGFSGGMASVHTGNFSKPAHGKLIKDGKVTDTAVDGFIVGGNLKDMFMNVVIADDTPALPNNKSSFAAPTARLDKMMIAGR